MGKQKTVTFNKSGIEKLPDDKPVTYKIKTKVGTTNYTGSAKRGRVKERIKEHLDSGKIPGAKVQIEQKSTIKKAQKTEERSIKLTKPKYNRKGK